MYNQEMEARIKQLEKQVVKLNDIEEIQRLQKSYGYYLQHWMYAELSDLWADSPEAELNILTGVFQGKDSVKKYFYSLKDQLDDPEFLHQLMQLSGIVDVAPDGNTARGRWFAWGALALPLGDLTHREGVKPLACDGIYSSEYVKEGGVWKLLKLKWNPIFLSVPSEGWVKKDRLQTSGTPLYNELATKPEKARDLDPRYPAGYIVPFHFKHPVTGKTVDVEKHNEDILKKLKP